MIVPDCNLPIQLVWNAIRNAVFISGQMSQQKIEQSIDSGES